MERYLSTAQVMQQLPIGRTSCVQLMHELGAVTFGKKLMIRESLIEAHLKRLEAARYTPTEQPTRRPKKKPPDMPLLTPDGKIPTRQQLRKMEEERKRGKRNDRSNA